MGRPAFGEAAALGHRRHAGQRRGDGVDVGQVHLQRVVQAFAQLERRHRRGRRGQHVALGEGAGEVLGDLPAHAQRLAVVGLVVPGAQHVGAQDDPALGLATRSPRPGSRRTARPACPPTSPAWPGGRIDRRRSGPGSTTPRRCRPGSRPRPRTWCAAATPAPAWPRPAPASRWPRAPPPRSPGPCPPGNIRPGCPPAARPSLRPPRRRPPPAGSAPAARGSRWRPAGS